MTTPTPARMPGTPIPSPSPLPGPTHPQPTGPGHPGPGRRGSVDMRALAAAVRYVAAITGQPTGTCPNCRRPVLLTSRGTIPDHRTTKSGREQCPGGEQPAPTGARTPADAGRISVAATVILIALACIITLAATGNWGQ